jgi:quercetin dioxygenase-like cupin family protein
VRVDPLFQAADPSRVSASLVIFEPGARTAWHTHPLGQRLVVTSSAGWVQCQGGAKSEIRARYVFYRGHTFLLEVIVAGA